MRKHDLLSKCPSCDSSLYPRVLACESCGIEIKGHFSSFPLAQLTSSELQFLQTFVMCEGRIRDVERALNISYPTVKSRLKQLKSRLMLKEFESPVRLNMNDKKQSAFTTADVLKQLEQGQVSFEEASQILKSMNREK